MACQKSGEVDDVSLISCVFGSPKSIVFSPQVCPECAMTTLTQYVETDYNSPYFDLQKPRVRHLF